MTGKAARVTLWPSACRLIGALLNNYEQRGGCCFEGDECEYRDDCNYERSQKCKFAQQFQKVKARLYYGGNP